MDLVITIDTEEDNWATYSATDNPVSNIEKLIPLQQMFDRYQVKPTYLISYPVATDPQAVEILKSFLSAGKCEIGTHCHPWNTPPFEEEINDINSMLCNLPAELVHKKLITLHQTICENFEIVPVSFRSGRWGFSSAVASSLVSLGYKVDTSVSPFIDWCEYHGPDYSGFPLHPYRFHPDDIAVSSHNGSLLEVPATVGFFQKNFHRCQQITKACENLLGKILRVKGILDRMGLVNKHWLSPELSDAISMVKLARRMELNGYPCINMSFHSNSLLPGCSPFVRTAKEEEIFLKKIETILEEAKKQQWISKTLAEMCYE